MNDETTNNKSKDITDIVPENVVDDIFSDLISDNPMNKQYKFFLYWLFGFPQKTCAKKAGYSESYASKLVRKYAKEGKTRRTVDSILNMFPERYRSVCKLRLPQVAEIEGKALQEYEDNPKLAIDKPQLLKQVKQSAGVIGDDFAPVTDQRKITVNIQQLFAQVQERKMRENRELDVIDVTPTALPEKGKE